VRGSHIQTALSGSRYLKPPALPEVLTFAMVLRKQMLIFEKVFDWLLKADEHVDKLNPGMVPAGTPK